MGKDEKIVEQKANEKHEADEEQKGDDHAEDKQVVVPVSTTQKERPSLLQSTSNHSVSSNFGNQFINSPNVSLIDAFQKVLQSHTEELKKELSKKRDYKDVIEELVQAHVINEVKKFLSKLNIVKIIDDAPVQHRFNEMVQAEKPPLTFDELMSTPIDFSVFIMNRLKLDKITREVLVGPVFNLLKVQLLPSYVQKAFDYRCTMQGENFLKMKIQNIEYYLSITMTMEILPEPTSNKLYVTNRFTLIVLSALRRSGKENKQLSRIHMIDFGISVPDLTQRPHEKEGHITLYPEMDQYAVLDIWHENILDGYCNGGNFPEAYHIGNSLHYQDLEWYEALEDSELKDEALRNKAIMEGLISDDDSSNDYWKRWKSHEIYYYDYDEGEYENETHEEGHELCGIKTREVPVFQIKRYKMIKYSFNDEEEYVAVKEDKYNDLTITSEEACRIYQEIFRMMDEGWMVTRTE
ncbi:hypothetical protein Tco_0462743 [Tanacetum coccineum]